MIVIAAIQYSVFEIMYKVLMKGLVCTYMHYSGEKINVII